MSSRCGRTTRRGSGCAGLGDVALRDTPFGWLPRARGCAKVPAVEPELPRLAYELSLRRLDRQENALSELRARTGTLLAASAVAASVLGTHALDRSHLRETAILGIGSFVVSILSAAFVLLPKQDLVFSISGSVLVEAEQSDEGGIGETYRRLSFWIDGFAEANDIRLQAIIRAYKIATLALVFEVILWSIELVMR